MIGDKETPEPIFIPLYSPGGNVAECGCGAATTPAGVHVYPCLKHSGIKDAFPQPQYISWTVVYDSTPEVDEQINLALERVPGARVVQAVPFEVVNKAFPRDVRKILVVFEGIVVEETP